MIMMNDLNLRINKCNLRFWTIVFLMYVGSMSPILTYIALVGIVLCAIFQANYYAQNPSVGCCFELVLLLVLQNFVIGCGAHIAGNTSGTLQYMTQVPFVVAFITWSVYFIRKNIKSIRLNIEEKIFFLLLICIVLSLINGMGSFKAILMNVRNMTLFFMVYQIGYHNLREESNIHAFERKILEISVVLLVVGVFFLIGGYDLYSKFGIDEIYAAKGSALAGALDGRFYTTLIHKQYMRMGSLYYEPVNLGYYFAISVLVASFGRYWKNRCEKWMFVFISGIGLILTFGKGGYLLVAAVVVCVFVYRILRFLRSQIGSKTIRNTIIIAMLLFIVVFCWVYVTFIGEAVLPHFWGIFQTLESVKQRPLGYGIGTGGNMATTLNGQGLAFDKGAETALMSYIYQLGIHGGIIFIISVINLSLRPRASVKKEYEIFYFIPSILIVMSLLQDNTFSPQCITAFMLLQGGVRRITERKAVLIDEIQYNNTGS